MDYKEITVTVSIQAVEAVAELFYSAGCTGVMIEDPNVLKEYIESARWDYHDLTTPKNFEFASVKGYFADNEFLTGRLAQLKNGLRQLLDIFPGASFRLGLHDVREEDWANAWKVYFKPLKVGRGIVVKPTWEEYSGGPDETVIEIDPGMAFGTGTHATTTLCLRAVEENVKPGDLVYDIGTGSGILAIAAALFGGQVKAVDLDPVAVRVARENVALNGLTDKVEVQHGNLADLLTEPADLVIANIIADVIIQLADDLGRILRPGGVCLASGIISERSKEVAEALTAKGLQIEQIDEENGWVLLRARRLA